MTSELSELKLVFLEKCQNVHGFKYNYYLVKYVGFKVKVNITCPDHGVFEQTPVYHLNGGGCGGCKNEKRKRELVKTARERFLKESSKIHSSKYDYSLVDYVDSRVKVKIICPEHGIFEQKPSYHIRGSKCSGCNLAETRIRQTKTQDDIINKFIETHRNKYNYSKVEYVNSHVSVDIICPEHGIFEQKPYSHINGVGCAKCKPNAKLTQEEVVERFRDVHGSKYDYSKVEFINTWTKVKIICPNHGVFEQTPSSHFVSVCRKCSDEIKQFDMVKKYTVNEKLGQELGLFYKLKFQHVSGFEFIKVGITSKGLKERYSSTKYKDFIYEVQELKVMTNLASAELERTFMKTTELKKFKFPKGVEFNGKSECFCV